MRGIRFLFLVVLVYILLFYFFPQKSLLALKESFSVLIKILPILLVVIFFNALINYFFKPKKLSYHLSKDRGIKAWIIALIAGILSHGPMYAWYPLIEDLKKKGLRDSLIAMFFYARAVKLPILPLMIHYFGLKFAIVLNIYIIIGAVLQGMIVEKIEKGKEWV
ncbi:permease [Nitrosophilus kaiyonis]|uniref:permease n=1 Tax=Nitrosophilus kaiyonis TaxID=2930200 RepID=UPI0024930365|nr:permease [Nitrosophilus kaiyonis]